MSDRRRHRTAFKFGAFALALLVLYPLSAGPVYLLHQTVPLSHQVQDGVSVFYYPLDLVTKAFPPIDRVLQAYLRCWDISN